MSLGPPEDYSYAKSCWDPGPGYLPSQFSGQMVPVVSWNSLSPVWQLTQGQRPPCTCLSLLLYCLLKLFDTNKPVSALPGCEVPEALHGLAVIGWVLGPPGSTSQPKLSDLWLAPGNHGKVFGGHDWPSLTSSKWDTSHFSDSQCRPGKESYTLYIKGA